MMIALTILTAVTMASTQPESEASDIPFIGLESLLNMDCLSE